MYNNYHVHIDIANIIFASNIMCMYTHPHFTQRSTIHTLYLSTLDNTLAFITHS